ncbi:MAG: NTP transferase domain-containing protein [Chlamydiia bacterium]|nr:NTP transferase domain-containing protein [Chlamydiia bacterium]
MNEEKTIGIIVARMASSRLPSKALRLVAGKPLLSYVLERLQAVSGCVDIWLATTQHPSDEQLLLWGIQQDIRVFGYQGETDDVVGRISAVVRKEKADKFLVVLGDTPFADPRLLNQMLELLISNSALEMVRIASDDNDRPHVLGGVGCYRAKGWEKVDHASLEPRHREHAGSILSEQPDLLSIGEIKDDPMYYGTGYRLTVDTQSDLELTEQIIKALQKPGEIIALKDIIQYLNENPELASINQHVRQKSVNDTSLKVLMAVQAGGGFGLGHLNRCKTLSRVLEDHFSAGVTFWLGNTNSPILSGLSKDGYRAAEENWSLPETVRQGNYDKVVIDFQTPVSPVLIQEIREAKAESAIIILDNNGLGCQDADAIVMPNAHAKPNPAWRLFRTKFYSGSPYVVLGNGFLYDSSHSLETMPLSQPVILVTMGGRDPGLMSEKVLEALKSLKDCHIDLVVPLMYSYPENLEKIATQLPSTITLHWKIQHLRPLMQRATVAIAAFGVTAYELAYLGIPTLVLGHYQSQMEDIDRFTEWGSAINIGYSNNFESLKVIEGVNELLSNENKRIEMSERGKSLCGKDGPLRVAEIITTTVREPLSSHWEP